MSRVLDNTSCDRGHGQIMYLLENASSPEPLDIATSKFAGV